MDALLEKVALAFGLLCALGLVLAALGLAASVLVTAFLAIDARFVPFVYNVRSLTRRKVTTGVTLLGLALVVCVFSAVSMLSAAISRTLVSAGQPDNAIVLRKGSQAEITSAIDRDQARLLAARPEVALDAKDGKPLADPQLAVLISARRVGANESANVLVRGCSERMLALHPGVAIRSGRFFRAGTSEVVIGKALVGKFEGATEGGELSIARRAWKVVGVIDSGGTGFDSEVWGDAEQVMPAFTRTMYSAMVMRVKDPKAIPALADAVSLDPQLSLDVKAERAYYEALSSGLSALVTVLGLFVAIVFSLGATLGAMIAMYAQVAARIREVGVLRALGYSRSSVLLSFVTESVLLGLAAGVVGVLLSSLAQLFPFSTLNFGSFSEVTFRLVLTPPVVVRSMIFAAVLGYAGGLLPALRAARTTIPQAMKGA